MFRQPLAHRVGADELLQLTDERSVSPRSEVRLDARLERLELQLLKPHDLVCRERLVGQVGQRRAARQAQRLAQHRRRALWPAFRQLPPSIFDEFDQPRRVELSGAHPQAVAG